jgi:hypothetical protein
MLTSHAIIGYTLQPEKESLVHSHHWIAGWVHLLCYSEHGGKKEESALLGVTTPHLAHRQLSRFINFRTVLHCSSSGPTKASIARTWLEFESHLGQGCACAFLFLICDVLLGKKPCSRLISYPVDNWWMVNWKILEGSQSGIILHPLFCHLTLSYRRYR